MSKLKILLIAVTFFSPSMAPAQGLVPTLDSEFEFCQDRPPEPEWMQNIHVRESYKRLLVQSIYRLEGYQRVANATDCTCDTLFPPWTDAVQHFNDNVPISRDGWPNGLLAWRENCSDWYLRPELDAV